MHVINCMLSCKDLARKKKIMYIIQAKRLNYSLSQHAQQKGHGQ